MHLCFWTILLHITVFVALGMPMEAAGSMCEGDTCRVPAVHSGNEHTVPASHRQLWQRCNSSLAEYHEQLTNWFTGVTDQNAFPALIRSLRLAPGAKIRSPNGRTITAERLPGMLEGAHDSAPAGSAHNVQRTSHIAHRGA